jgi:DNA-binding NtrC family response regulator
MSKRILIVNDEADINIVLREILESNGFTVDSFYNPHDA